MRSLGFLSKLALLAAVIVSAFINTREAAAQTGQWTLKSPATSPGARAAHAMAYDPIRRETVVFGGYGGPGGYWGDTWAWDGTNWTLKATTGPSPRANVSMSFDSARQVIVLFGGYFGGPLGETWEWNGTAWTQRFPTGSVPAARADYGLAYDTVRAVTVLAAGGGTSGWLSDTWEWNGTSWLERAGANGPGRSGPGMAFDSRRGVMTLFGGDVSNSAAGMRSDTFEFDGLTWSFRTSIGPSPRRYVPMAYDTVRGVTVLTGGNFYGQTVGGTFEWDGAVWTQLAVGGPTAVQGHNLAFDTTRGELVQFGGGSGLLGNQTWVLQSLQPISTDWTSFNASQAVGVLNGRTVTLTAYLPGAITNNSVVDGTSTIFNEASLFTPQLPTSDVIYFQANPAGVTYTLEFGQPVTNPVLHLTSMAATLTFPGVSPIKLSGQSTLSVSGNQVIGNFVGPPPSPYNDANGTIRLPGTFSSVTFTAQWAPGLDGIGLQLGLGSAIPFAAAGPTDNAIAPGTRPDPGSGSTTSFTFNTLTIPTGGSFTLGSGETINVPGGLTIQPGGVLIANGTINGPLFNAGLLIIPITQAGLIFNTSGPGTIIITQPPITQPEQPPVIIPVPPSNPPIISAGSYVSIGGSGFSGTNGGTPGGGAPGSGYPGRYQIPGPTTVRGTIAWDGQLDVNGTYTQTASGVLRMFIAGTDKGKTHSHLNVGLTAQIAGELQVVLQPELFNYLPQQGNSFDFIFAAGGLSIDASGLSVRTLMTAAGASYLGVSLPPFLSGFVADPNQLVSLPANLFTFSIIGGNTLRVTLVDPVICGVLRAPQDRPTCPTGGGFFTAVVPGSLPGTFQWQYRGTGGRPPIDWVDLVDGPNSFGGDFSFVVSSATAQTLTFTRAGNPATAFGIGAGGEFRCQITSPCGTAPTPPAPLSICKTDVNCDAYVNIQDVFGFLNDWFAGSQAADYNGGGLSLQDIFDFLNAWFTGC